MTHALTGPVAAEIEQRLRAALAPTRLAVINDSAKHRGHAGDDGSGESHFTVEIEAPAFAGMSRLERQRAVNAALGDLMRGARPRAGDPGEGAGGMIEAMGPARQRRWSGSSLARRARRALGLPADACRVHGWLYLTGRAATAAELAAAVRLPLAETRSALAWLADHGLAEADEAVAGLTGDDPWELVMRALERRRDRELGPALELLRASRREAASNPKLADADRASARARRRRGSDRLAGPPALDAITAQADEAGGRAARLLGSVLGPARRPPHERRRRRGRGAFKVNWLTGLDRASAVEGRSSGTAPRSLWNGMMLGGALVLGPLTFGWSAFAIFLVTAGITLCAGHSVGFHRRLIHRSFECPKWLDWT